jgi:hypothetical protein
LPSGLLVAAIPFRKESRALQLRCGTVRDRQEGKRQARRFTVAYGAYNFFAAGRGHPDGPVGAVALRA